MAPERKTRVQPIIDLLASTGEPIVPIAMQNGAIFMLQYYLDAAGISYDGSFFVGERIDPKLFQLITTEQIHNAIIYAQAVTGASAEGSGPSGGGIVSQVFGDYTSEPTPTVLSEEPVQEIPAEAVVYQAPKNQKDVSNKGTAWNKKGPPGNSHKAPRGLGRHTGKYA